MNKLTVFDKEYDGESLYDLSRDIGDALDERYNAVIGKIPQDEHGFQLGTFKVAIIWEADEC